MIVSACRWSGRSCVKVIPEKRDAKKLGTQPTTGDWLGRLVAVVKTADMKVNAANVFFEPVHVVIVPEARGFKQLRDATLERALSEFMAAVKAHLESNGFSVTLEDD